MNKSGLVYFAFLLMSTPVLGQFTNTNDWIDFSLEYYRIAVVEDGIQLITKSDLSDAGMPVKSIGDDKYHMYHNGKEVPIYVTGSEITFYGESAKGDLDVALYEEPGNQAHQEQSLYADSGYYYLTYSSSPGLRYKPVTQTDVNGLSKMEHHNQRQVVHFSDAYYDGERPFVTLFHPMLARGEGWQSKVALRTSSYITADFDVSDFVSGSSGRLETTVCGANDLLGRMADGYNNHAVFEAYSQGKWGMLTDKYFRGYSAHEFDMLVQESNIDNGQLKIRARADEYYNGKKVFRGRYSVSHYDLTYTAHTKILNGQTASFEFENSASNRYIEATNFLGNQAVILDVNNQTIINSTRSGSTLTFRINQGSNDHHVVIADTGSIKRVKPVKHKFHDIEVPTGTNFLIISNKKLKNSVSEYATFRSSAAGGSYNVHVAYVDEIFDEYYFGYHHPLAIKLFFKDLLDENKNPQNVFLIGKAIDIKHFKNNGAFDYSLDLVPSIGSPSSDWYYLRYLNPSSIVPPFSISRLSVSNDDDVRTYLTKVKTYEALDDARWRKDVIHVSGGKSGNELDRFSSYMDRFGGIISDPYMGANIYYFGKESGLEIDDNLTDFILEKVNNGAGFFSYFGHAGSNVTEVDLSTPIDYHNSNSPMVMYFGGCVLGSCYEKTPLLGEEFISAPTGAVAWIAAGSFSFEPTVYEYTLRFYENLGLDFYGATLGEITRQTINDFMDEGDRYKEAQAWQTLIQGDPVIRVYSPELPDYEITNADVYITPDDVTAQSDSFLVNMNIRNHGKALPDSFDMVYTLKFPSGISKTDTVKLPGVYNSSLLSFTFYNDQKEFGNYQIEIVLDEGDVIPEIREHNNTATYNFNLISNGAVGLFPPSYGIVNQTEIELTGQSLDINSINNTYIFEVDTTPGFMSPWRKQSGELKGNLVGTWKVKLLQNDSQDYYWRMRMKLKDGSLSPWSEKSFSYIKNSLDGWAQIDFKQLANSDVVDLYADTSRKSFRFERFTSPGQFIMNNHGRDYPVVNNYTFNGPKPIDNKIIRNNKYAQVNGSRTYNGIVCYVISPNMDADDNFEPYVVDAGVDMGDRGIEYQFDWMASTEQIKPEVLESFIDFLNNVPSGYHIFAYSGYYHRIGDMPDRFYQALERFGSSKIRKVKNDDVWLFIGTKGLTPGKAHDEQFTSDQDSLLVTSVTFTVTKFQGTTTSQIIGPSRKWRQLSLSTGRFITESDKVQNSYKVYGISLDGKKTLLVDNFKQNYLDLTFIDARKYPYLQLVLSSDNQITYIPAQPKRWIVNYDYLPEGLVNSELAYKFTADTIQKGQVLDFEIGYQNISTLSLEDIVVSYQIIDKNRNEMFQDLDTLKPLAPGESTVISKSFSSDYLVNSNKLIVLTNPGLIQPELYAFNNNFEKTFFVEGDHELPIMEVTFDGYRILNGDIVSPTPTIVITGKDNNSYFLLDDPDYFDITLEYPDSILPRELDPSMVTFYPATDDNKTARIEYEPQEALPDGIYTLTVQLRDASGNESGKVEYKVTFEVVGESTISNFYPYPNPFTSQMRFVYTLTGEQLPDDIVIQIMTVSGKVVREIHMDELGPMKIGHNVSDFTWDGTDMYGNRLANGVYLYRVKTVMDGQTMDHRNSGNNLDATEGSFNEGFGKIYILR